MSLLSPASYRRHAKWPYVVGCALALVGASAYFFAQSPPLEKEGELRVQTWSRFHEHKRLKMLLQGFAVRSLADIPCVDLDQVDIHQLGVERYYGVTKDRELACALQAQRGSQGVSFIERDVTVDRLPHVDLILAWDYLCGLSAEEIRSTLLQFKRSGATFLLMRHFPEVRENGAKRGGTFQPINWKHHPYHFPEPMIHIMESSEYGMESLALWNLRDLP